MELWIVCFIGGVGDVAFFITIDKQLLKQMLLFYICRKFNNYTSIFMN